MECNSVNVTTNPTEDKIHEERINILHFPDATVVVENKHSPCKLLLRMGKISSEEYNTTINNTETNVIIFEERKVQN